MCVEQIETLRRPDLIGRIADIFEKGFGLVTNRSTVARAVERLNVGYGRSTVPIAVQGPHRATRHAAFAEPFANPYFRIASRP